MVIASISGPQRDNIPPIYVVTPTFRRSEQLAELTRLGYTLKHVPNLFWLVVEDSITATPAVTKLLNRIGVPFVHLVGEFLFGGSVKERSILSFLPLSSTDACQV